MQKTSRNISVDQKRVGNMDKDKKELLVWKHKVPLDKEMLDRISKFYRANVPDDAIGVECFSHPSLNAHECNPAAKLAGGTDCQFCNHIFERSCQITCNISRFCLMVFAYRIGLGGEDFERALQHNGQMNYEKLYKMVQQRLADLERGGTETLAKDELQLNLEFKGKGKRVTKGVAKDSPKNALPSSRSSVMRKKKPLINEPEIVMGEGDEDWLTISEAAELYNCSYVNIYSHAKKGNLKVAKIRGVKRVRKSEIMKLKEMNGK